MQITGLKKRSETHTARRIWHLTGVLAMLLIYRSIPQFEARLAITLGFLAFVPLDFLRLKLPPLNKALVKLFSPIMRESEIHSLAGTSYLLTGALVLIFCFPYPIASLSLLFLALADPAASYFGVRFGKHKILREKSLEGSMAAFFVCFIATWSFLIYEELFTENIPVISLLGGLIGALAEVLPIGRLDDNLSLPLLSALGLSLVFYMFGGTFW